MLLDMQTPAPVLDGIKELEASPFSFYLTGSRFFGCETTKSDWDFMTADSPEVRDFLDSIGFTYDVLEYAELCDDLTAGVRQLGTVQVQLCHDVQMKRAVRDGIHRHNRQYHRYSDSGERTRLWNDWHSILQRREVAFF